MRKDATKIIYGRAKSGRTWVSKTQRDKRVLLDQNDDRIEYRSPSGVPQRVKLTKRGFNIIERVLVPNTDRQWHKPSAEVCAIAGGEIRWHLKDVS